MPEAPDSAIPNWPFRPNWISDLTETLDWKTRVLDSKSGAEQRMAMRLSPRRMFEYEVLRTESERTFLELMLHRFGGSDVMLPLWHDAGRLTAEVTSGATTLPVDTTFREFVVGGYAWLQGASAFEGERVEIEAISDTELTIAAPGTTSAWSARAKVFPMRRARMTDQPDLERLSSRIMTSSIRFELTRANDWDGEFIFSLYRDNPVLTLRPEEGSGLAYGRDRRVERLDNETGLTASLDVSERAFGRQEYRWWLKGREKHAEHRDLLYALQGRYKAVWVPTFNDDLFLAEAITVGATEITVNQAGYTVLGAVMPGRRDIRIELKSGTTYHRRVTALGAPVAGFDVLVLDSAIPANVALADVVRISFMDIYRLDQDVIEIAHRADTDGLATSTATFRAFSDTRLELPDNYVPIPDAEMTLEACGEGIEGCAAVLTLDTLQDNVLWFPVHMTRDAAYSVWVGEDNGIDWLGVMKNADHTWVSTANHSTSGYLDLIEGLIGEDASSFDYRGAVGIPGTDYFLIHHVSGVLGHHFLLMEIDGEGAIADVGHCWTNLGGLGGLMSPRGCGFVSAFSSDSRLLVWGEAFQVASGITLAVLDTIVEMKAYTLATQRPSRVATIGSSISYFQGDYFDNSGAPNWYNQGFLAPMSPPRLYFYASRDTVQRAEDNSGIGETPWIEDNKAAYPNGFMFYGEITIEPILGTPAFVDWTVCNDDFDMNGPPFEDEDKNIDGTTWDETGEFVGYQSRFAPVPMVGGGWAIAFHKELNNEINSSPCGMSAQIVIFNFFEGAFTYRGQLAKKTVNTVASLGIDEADRYGWNKRGANFFFSPTLNRFYEAYSIGSAPGQLDTVHNLCSPYMNYVIPTLPGL